MKQHTVEEPVCVEVPRGLIVSELFVDGRVRAEIGKARQRHQEKCQIERKGEPAHPASSQYAAQTQGQPA